MKLQKHTLNLRAGDWEELDRHYTKRGIPTSSVIRQVISRFVDAIRSADTSEEELSKIKGEL